MKAREESGIDDRGDLTGDADRDDLCRILFPPSQMTSGAPGSFGVLADIERDGKTPLCVDREAMC